MKNCLNCNNELQNQKNKFCNSSCAATYNNKTMPKRKKEGICLECKQPCFKSQVYCSNICYNIVRNRNKLPNSRHKESNKKYVKEFHRNSKLKALEYKGGCCQICGYKKCIRNLHFHHIDESTKSFTISGNSISWERLKPELDKCALLCANCHGEVHDHLISI